MFVLQSRGALLEKHCEFQSSMPYEEHFIRKVILYTVLATWTVQVFAITYKWYLALRVDLFFTQSFVEMYIFQQQSVL